MTDPQHLVDGKYAITDLVDINRLQGIFEKFTAATGFTIGFLDHPGLNVLCATGWRDICTQFHRCAPASLDNCIKSNHHLLDQLKELGQVVVEACENGLVDCATPIIVKGVHVASLATGQLLLEEPDPERFKRQAELFQFDEKSYMAALAEIPVVSKDQLKKVTSFLGELALIISELGYATLEIKDKNVQLELDIVEHKRMEEFKDSVLKNVAHELRTPLHAMAQGIEFLSSEFAGRVTDDQAEVLEITQQNLKRLSRLVNSFLDLQRLEAAVVTLNLQKTQLNELLNHAGEIMQPLVSRKNLKLSFHLDTSLPEVLCDPDRMMQVMINLIDNAVKFTNKGVITVSSIRTDEKIVIRVEDHGIGIRKEDHSRLFNKFVQLEDGRSISATGTGLGLAISKTIIQMHHGIIDVEADYGKGSVFYFELPFEQPHSGKKDS